MGFMSRSSIHGKHLSIQEALAQLPGPQGQRFAEVFRHGTLSLEIYAPEENDPQQPHMRDEVYIVVKGSGEYLYGEQRAKFEVGDVLFAPAGVSHRFENFTDDLIVWVIFYGPEGGESS
jgi:mannose-6-phosphate isomerase-like protein (cupin superfamily)